MSVQRNYKDRLFRRLFGGEDTKENLLMLYNALNGTDYVNTDDLTVNTIEDVIYMKMKNDVSCIVDGRLSLFEHQSTFSPNLPVRGMMYFAKMYDRIIEEDRHSLYGRTLIKLPTPQFFVLYNGEDNLPDVMKLQLSDAFEKPDETGGFEWTATLININAGHSRDILAKCEPLSGYQTLVEKVRENKALGEEPRKAVDDAVMYCISHNILADYLKKHRSEVVDMVLTEYDEKVHEEKFRYEGYEMGLEQGLEQGKQTMLYSLVLDGLITITDAARKSGMSEEDFVKAMKSNM